MKKITAEKLKSFTNYELHKKKSDEYFLDRRYFNDSVISAHNNGYRPIDHIENDYFEELGLNVSKSFFKWYLLNYCKPCETYTAYDLTPLEFYDIVDCSKQLKKSNLKLLKTQYKNYTKTQKSLKHDNAYYFAEIEYYKKPTDKHHVVTLKDYAVIFNGWAYLNPNGKYKRVKIHEKPTKYDNKILRRYKELPEEMDPKIAESILNKIIKSHPNLHPKN